MNRNELYDYILENYTIDGTTASLVNSILFYIESMIDDVVDQRIAVRRMLDGTFDLPCNILNNVKFKGR